MNNDKFEDYDYIDQKNSPQKESALFADAIALFFNHKMLFGFCILASLVIGFLYIRFTPKTFMRKATVIIKDEKKGAGMEESQAFKDMFSLGVNSVENEIGIFGSHKLMYRVARRLHLDISYRLLNNLKKKELYSSAPFSVHFLDETSKSDCSFVGTLLSPQRIELSEMVSDKKYNTKMEIQVGDSVETPVGWITVSLSPSFDLEDLKNPILVSKLPLTVVANSYCHKLNFEMVGQQSSLIKLSIMDENATRAENVLNTLIDVYNKDAIDDKNKITINTGRFIDERLKIIEKDLSLVDSEIEDYKKENKLTDLASESDFFLKNSNQLDNEGLSVENQLNMAEYMKAYLLRNNKNTEMIPASVGINDSGIQQQISEYNELVSKRNKLMTNSGIGNPLVQDIDATLKSYRKAILRSIDNWQTSSKIQSLNLKSKEQENMNKIAHVPTQQKHIISIERQQKIKEELYLYLLKKKEENELQQTIAESNCRIVDMADGPSSPVSPQKTQIVLICLIFGFVVPSLWLYLKFLLNTNVCTKDDLKNKVSIPFLGEVPFDKNNKSFLVSKGNGNEAVNEALRIIRENLRFMNTNMRKGGKVIQFISFNPNAGKTFISANLAANMAFSNLKVIVLDLDLRKASLTKRLNIEKRKYGLSFYLNGEIQEINQLIHTIDVNGVSFDMIPSGVIPPNPAELLKGERLGKMIEVLKQRYDYILFDNPPYGLVVDASICSHLADNSIYIIRAGMFDKRLFSDLQELSDSGKIKKMSIILNAVDYKKMAYRYKYHYSYHYKYEQRYEDETQKKGFFRRFFGR